MQEKIKAQVEAFTQSAAKTYNDVKQGNFDSLGRAVGEVAIAFILSRIPNLGFFARTGSKGGENLPKFKLGPLTTEEANISFIQKGMQPPYDVGVRPRTIQLQKDKVLLRVYNEDKYAAGQWMLRPKEIEGLTPLEIQNRFALPVIPTKFIEVHLPAGTYLRVGRAAAQDGWGPGGAIQYQVLERLPRDYFQNPTLLQKLESEIKPRP